MLENDREDQHHDLSDVKLLQRQQHCDAYNYVITCTKKIFRQIVAEMCEKDFNASSL